MASSNKTYNIFLRHAPADSLIVAALACGLRGRGLRPWFERHSFLPAEQPGAQAAFAMEASQTLASVMGPSGLAHWLEEAEEIVARLEANSTITILMPGFHHSLTDLPSHLTSGCIVDMRKGLDDENAWEQLTASIASLSIQPEATADLSHELNSDRLKRNTICSYDRIAEKFASTWFAHPPVLAIEKLLRRLPRRAAVLDAGCGPGHHAKLIAKSGHEVIGVDLSREMLKIAGQSVQSARFKKMDIQHLTFAPNTFDAIWCAGAALHVPREEIVQLLGGYRRVLRPKGVLGINLQIGRQSEVVDYGEDHRFFEYYRDSLEIAELLSLAGFSVEAQDHGETTRNTHHLDIKLKWATLYARPNEKRVSSSAGTSRVASLNSPGSRPLLARRDSP